MDDELSQANIVLVGINEVDQQHRDIVESVNALCDAVKDGKNKEELISFIEKLDSYTEFHFRTEENYMELYNYEKMDEHKKAHKFFKDTYNQIRTSYFYVDEQKLPRDNVVNLYSLLLAQTFKSWLIFHLQTYDKEFAVFIQKNIKD